MASVFSTPPLSPELDLDAPPSSVLLLAGRMFPLAFATGEFTIHGQPILVIEQENSGAGTGHTVWDGAVVLAKYLEARFPSMSGQRVVEVGCGPALAGQAAAALGATVFLTDLPYALPNVRAAVGLNSAAHVFKSPSPPAVCALEWFAPAAATDACEGLRDATLILGSDVVWVSELIEPLVATLAHLSVLSARGSGTPPTILIAHQTRSTVGDALFEAALAAARFDVSLVDGGMHHPSFSGGDVIRILELRLRKGAW